MPKQFTDLAVKNAKPKIKKYMIATGSGLNLLVMPDGAKYWRFRYYYGGKAKMISVGRPYPETTFKAAAAETARFKALVNSGTDPADERTSRRIAQREHVSNTFGEAAEAWYIYRCKAWAPRTAEQFREYLDKDLLPKLKSRPLNSISPQELGVLVAGIEERGAYDVAKKVRQWLKTIYAYARAKGWTTNDPAADLGAIAAKGPAARNYPHIEKEELPVFLAQLDRTSSAIAVKGCLMLAIWLGHRPGVTRTLKWSELDLDAGVWEIAKGRVLMKRGYRATTPLPVQAVSMLRELREVTGSFQHVFIGRNDPGKPLSDGAVNGLIKRMGYRGKQCAHGFRHVLSTCMNELGYEEDWIERQLSHGDPDAIRGTYNKATYLDQRRIMLQEWADMVDLMRKGQTWSRAAALVNSDNSPLKDNQNVVGFRRTNTR